MKILEYINKYIFFTLFLSLFSLKSLTAYDPRNNARYDSTANIFWFIQISDTHIGKENENKLKDDENLRWILNSGVPVVNPMLVINTGDLTDATKGGLWPWYGLNIQRKDEWLLYKQVTKDQSRNFYFDVPGNHDRYGDSTWSGLYDPEDSTWFGYTSCSVQGPGSNPVGEFSKTVTLPNGDSYLFIGINTNDSTGLPYNQAWFVSDYPELSEVEREFIRYELYNFGENPKHKLSFLFGHASIYRLTGWTPNLMDEWYLNEVAERGAGPLVSLMNQYNVSSYLFGHTHKSKDLYDLNSQHNISSRLINTSSLTEQDTYRIVAIDNDGISTSTFQIQQWPLVLITSPLDTKSKGLNLAYSGVDIDNPYSYTLKSDSTNFVRALVFFDSAQNVNDKKVEFRYLKKSSVEGWKGPIQMTEKSENVWQGGWDCSTLESGEYEVEVKAIGLGGKEATNTIIVKIDNKECVFLYPNSGEVLSGVFLLKAFMKNQGRLYLAEFYYSENDKFHWIKIGESSTYDKNVQISFDSKVITASKVWFKVKTYELFDIKEDESDEFVTIDNVLPTAPVLSAKPVKDGCIELSWTSSTDDHLAGYKIFRTILGEPYSLHYDGITGNLFTDSFTENGVTYYYRIKAYDLAGNESEISNITHAISDTTLPVIVSFPAGFTNSRQITITAYDSLSGMEKIELTGPNSFNTTLTFTGETTPVTATFSGVSEGAYTASVYDQAGNGVFKNFTLDTTLPAIISLKNDTTVIPFGGYSRFNSISVYARDTLSGMKEIKLTGPSSFSTTLTGETDTVSVNFDSLLDGYYTVSVSDQAGSNVFKNFTKDTTSPILNFIALPGDSTVILKWTNPADVDFIGVKLTRNDSVTVYIGTDSTFTDSGLLNDQQYSYAIRAYDRVGNSTDRLYRSIGPHRGPMTLVFEVQTYPGFYDPRNVLDDYKKLMGELFTGFKNNRISGDLISIGFFSNSPLGDSRHTANAPIKHLAATSDFDSALTLVSEINDLVKIYNTTESCGNEAGGCHKHDGILTDATKHNPVSIECRNCHGAGAIMPGSGFAQAERKLGFEHTSGNTCNGSSCHGSQNYHSDIGKCKMCHSDDGNTLVYHSECNGCHYKTSKTTDTNVNAHADCRACHQANVTGDSAYHSNCLKCHNTETSYHSVCSGCHIENGNAQTFHSVCNDCHGAAAVKGNKKRLIAFSVWNTFTWQMFGRREEPKYLKHSIEDKIRTKKIPVAGIDFTDFLNSDGSVNEANYLAARNTYQYNASRISAVLKSTHDTAADAADTAGLFLFPEGGHTTKADKEKILGIKLKETVGEASPYLVKGNKYTKSFSIENGVEEINISVWGDKGVMARLYSPDGEKMERETDPSVKYIDGNGFLVYSIKTPAEGLWQLEIDGANLAVDSTKIGYDVLVRGGCVKLECEVPAEIEVGKNTNVRAVLKKENGAAGSLNIGEVYIEIGDAGAGLAPVQYVAQYAGYIEGRYGNKKPINPLTRQSILHKLIGI